MNYPSPQAEWLAEIILAAKDGNEAAIAKLRNVLKRAADAAPWDVVIKMSKLLLDNRFEDARKTLEVEE